MVDYTMTQLIEVILWASLAFSFTCLVYAMITDNRKLTSCSENYKTENKSHITDQSMLNSRCGPKCQNVHPDKKPWKTPSEFYPNLPKDPTSCNPMPNRWAEMSPPESLNNLTQKHDGKRFICNRSCPPQEVACGLSDKGLGDGVMDSVTQAEELGSAEFVKGSYLNMNQCQKENFTCGSVKKNSKSEHEVDCMGKICCVNGQPQLYDGSAGTIDEKECKKRGGTSFTNTVTDCMI